MAKLTYNEEWDQMEQIEQSGHMETQFIVPPYMTDGDNLTPFQFTMFPWRSTFYLFGRYNAKSDMIQCVIAGPPHHKYKVSFSDGNSPYGWKIKKHGITRYTMKNVGWSDKIIGQFINSFLALAGSEPSPAYLREIIKADAFACEDIIGIPMAMLRMSHKKGVMDAKAMCIGAWSFFGPSLPEAFCRCHLKVMLYHDNWKRPKQLIPFREMALKRDNIWAIGHKMPKSRSRSHSKVHTTRRLRAGDRKKIIPLRKIRQTGKGDLRRQTVFGSITNDTDSPTTGSTIRSTTVGSEIEDLSNSRITSAIVYKQRKPSRSGLEDSRRKKKTRHKVGSKYRKRPKKKKRIKRRKRRKGTRSRSGSSSGSTTSNTEEYGEGYITILSEPSTGTTQVSLDTITIAIKERPHAKPDKKKRRKRRKKKRRKKKIGEEHSSRTLQEGKQKSQGKKILASDIASLSKEDTASANAPLRTMPKKQILKKSKKSPKSTYSGIQKKGSRRKLISQSGSHASKSKYELKSRKLISRSDSRPVRSRRKANGDLTSKSDSCPKKRKILRRRRRKKPRSRSASTHSHRKKGKNDKRKKSNPKREKVMVRTTYVSPPCSSHGKNNTEKRKARLRQRKIPKQTNRSKHKSASGSNSRLHYHHESIKKLKQRLKSSKKAKNKIDTVLQDRKPKSSSIARSRSNANAGKKKKRKRVLKKRRKKRKPISKSGLSHDSRKTSRNKISSGVQMSKGKGTAKEMSGSGKGKVKSPLGASLRRKIMRRNNSFLIHPARFQKRKYLPPLGLNRRYYSSSESIPDSSSNTRHILDSLSDFDPIHAQMERRRRMRSYLKPYEGRYFSRRKKHHYARSGSVPAKVKHENCTSRTARSLEFRRANANRRERSRRSNFQSSSMCRLGNRVSKSKSASPTRCRATSYRTCSSRYHY